MSKLDLQFVWKDRKRPFMGLPLSFTKYRLTTEKLLIETGILNITQEEIRLYRIMDMTLRKSLFQRIFGVGTIHCCTADKSTPEFDIVSIKNPNAVKEMISEMIEKERDKKRIASREVMGGDGMPGEIDEDH